MRFLATTTEILQFYVYLKSNPILHIVGGFLHRGNTAERTTSTAGQPAGSTGPWPQPTTKDNSFWWLYSAIVGSDTDQPLPEVQPLTEDGHRCLPELLDFAGDQACKVTLHYIRVI